MFFFWVSRCIHGLTSPGFKNQQLEANVDTARKKHEALKAKKAKTAPEKLTAALNDEAEALVAFEDAQTTLEAELVRVNEAVCTDGATAMVALLCAHDVFLNSVSVALDAALKAVTPLANTSVEQLLKDKRLPRLAAMRHRDEFDDAVDDDDVVRRAKEKLQAEYDQKLAKAILALETTANEREAVRADELADLESTKASAKAMRAELADEKLKFEQQKADAEARIAKLNSDAEREYERLRQTRLKELDRLKAEAKGEKAESDSDDDAAAKDDDAADSDSEESGDSNALCERCNLPIVGDVVEAMGAQWHDACFVCNSCGCDLSGGFVRYEGKPSCVSCKKKAVQKQKDDAAAAAAEAEDKEKEKEKEKSTTSEATTTKPEATATTDGEAALKCASCQLAIKGDQLDDAVRALDRDWHAKCFRCAVCKEELRYGYIRVEDGAWCRDCRKKDKDQRKAKKSAK
jgi:hypothetical protein